MPTVHCLRGSDLDVKKISSSLLLVLLEPICTFSDAKRANGSTAKGASRKGAVPAHLPGLRASLLWVNSDANGTGELWGVCRNGFFSQLPIDFQTRLERFLHNSHILAFTFSDVEKISDLSAHFLM